MVIVLEVYTITKVFEKDLAFGKIPGLGPADKGEKKAERSLMNIKFLHKFYLFTLAPSFGWEHSLNIYKI